VCPSTTYRGTPVMAALWRNSAIVILLLLVLAAGTLLLDSTLLICLLAALLAFGGVVAFRGNRWRTGALLGSAVALAAGLLDIVAGWVAPAPAAVGAGLVRTTDPSNWTVGDADLGYRPVPSTNIRASASVGDQTVFNVTYTINADSTRATP